MDYLMDQCCIEDDNGNYWISKQHADKWIRERKTEYKDLSEKEKDSDRREVDDQINIICEYYNE